MDQFPFGYERIHETSWAWLSSLLMLALFFKFNRFWSFRNLDLVLLILLAPGILLVNYREIPKRSSTVPAAPLVEPGTSMADALNGWTGNAPATFVNAAPARDWPASSFQENAGATPGADTPGAGEAPSPPAVDDSEAPVAVSDLSRIDLVHRAGFIWLFSVGLLLLLRMLLDPLLVRRPLLEPNISLGGLVFLGCSLLTFIAADIITARPEAGSLSGAIGAMKLVQREAAGEEAKRELLVHGPGYALLHVIPALPTFTAGRNAGEPGSSQPRPVDDLAFRLEVVAKTLAITAQIALVFGLVAMGYFHFSSFRAGIGMAVIWLMLPYTIMYSGNTYHMLPAALMVWAAVLYRQPLVAGLMLGLATGVSYYPLFLLPLWLSFYWESRVGRFVAGFVTALAVCIGGLAFTSESVQHFFEQLQAMFGFWLPRLDRGLLQGIWVLGWDPWFRLPALVAFVVLSVSFIFWPARKDLGTLIAYTSCLMVAVQFWHGYEGGTFIAWYLPLLLAMVFRPNLSERLAATQIPSQRRHLRVDPPQRVVPAA